MIDAGVGILNPIQLPARNIDPVKLKKEFGANLTFWAAGISTQTAATLGNVDDIKNEVESLIKIFAPGR